MVSVVIAAHNEESTLGATLGALLGQAGAGTAEVVVSANACTDRTVQIAGACGAIVVDRAEQGKAAALNAADAVATGYPRIYLDADIVLPPGSVPALLRHFDQPSPPLAVVPRRRVDASGSSVAVRAYCLINERLPAFRRGLFGRGIIVLSEAGRRRFHEFPTMIADDLYVDSQFTDDEREEAEDVEIVVTAPRTARGLVRRLVRLRRGNTQLRVAAAHGSLRGRVRPSDRWSWWRDVVLPAPHLLPAGLLYCTITLLAAALARHPSAAENWDRAPDARMAVVGRSRTAR